MTDTKLLELAKEIVTLKNKIKESGRYKLREQVAALTKERDEALRVTFDVRVIEQLAAAQATNVKLREALKRAGEAEAYASHDDSVGYYVCCQVASYKPHAKGCYIQEALALPNDTTALDARLKEERERMIALYSPDDTAQDWIDKIRSMT